MPRYTTLNPYVEAIRRKKKRAYIARFIGSGAYEEEEAWSPSALFASSEVGVWYDPSDLSTMFQDSAGTTPVTAVGQPVGRLLDKSQGLVLGSELVTNGTFDTDTTGWIFNNFTGDANEYYEVTNGELHVISANGTQCTAATGSILTAGKFYRIRGTIRTINSNRVAISCGSSDSAFKIITSAATHQLDHIVKSISGGMLRFINDTSAAIEYYLDNISVKELPGNHALEATAAERPLLDTANLINYDGTDDLLTASNPDLGSDVTIARATAGGVSILTGQTVGANYVDNTDHYGLVIVNRALTAGETASLTTYLEAFIP